MTQEEKIKYMEMAANFCKFMLDNAQLGVLVAIYEKILEKGGDTDLSDLAVIKADFDKSQAEPTF